MEFRTHHDRISTLGEIGLVPRAAVLLKLLTAEPVCIEVGLWELAERCEHDDPRPRNALHDVQDLEPFALPKVLDHIDEHDDVEGPRKEDLHHPSSVVVDWHEQVVVHTVGEIRTVGIDAYSDTDRNSAQPFHRPATDVEDRARAMSEVSQHGLDAVRRQRRK